MPGAVWPERELQDMYTVSFEGLQDTRRLLLDYKTSRGVLSPNSKILGLNHYSTFYDLYYI
jgi:NADH:ubiquinone oxidoreductase subunit C